MSLKGRRAPNSRIRHGSPCSIAIEAAVCAAVRSPSDTWEEAGWLAYLRGGHRGSTAESRADDQENTYL